MSRDQAILGQSETSSQTPEDDAQVSTGTVIDMPIEVDQQPAPGSLQEQIQREVDAVETAPIPRSRLEDEDAE